MTFSFISQPFARTCTDAARSLLGDSVRRMLANRHLTPQERANLMAGYTPPAIVTASLGGASTPR
jgi:hypothetical protein